MDDQRIWNFEERLWVGGPQAYEEQVSDTCVMALPAEPFLFDGPAAIAAVKDTPRWDSVDFADTRVERPEEGLIVIAYRAEAKRGEENYHALCTSTLRRLEHEEWRVVQHQQTPLGVKVTDPSAE